MSWLIGLLALASSAELCPDSDTALLNAATELAMLRLAGAELALGKAQDSFACGPMLNPRQAAWYFQSEAVLLLHQAADPGLAKRESEILKTEALADISTAHAVESDWNPDLGEGAAYHLFLDVKAHTGASVPVELANLGADEWVAIDGEFVSTPVRVVPGVHILQVGPKDGPARFGRVLAARGSVHIELPPDSDQTGWRDVKVEIHVDAASQVEPVGPLPAGQARVTVTGDVSRVYFVPAGGGASLSAGILPPGNYAVHAFFDDKPHMVRQLTLRAGDEVTITCVQRARICR